MNCFPGAGIDAFAALTAKYGNFACFDIFRSEGKQRANFNTFETLTATIFINF